MYLFEITIQRKNGQEWPVVALRQRPGDLLPLRTEGFLKLDLGSIPLTIDPMEYGLHLGQALFKDLIRDAFVQALAEARHDSDILRILLFVEGDDLRTLHWERLCAPIDDRWDFLALNQETAFSQYLPSQTDRRFSPIGRRDLRALLLVGGPGELNGDYGLADFDVPTTISSLTTAFGEIECDVLAALPDVEGQPDLDTLCERLTTHHNTLLHIVCHGKYNEKEGETVLYFPGANGRPVTGTALIERLGRLKSFGSLPHFIYLSTCESADPLAENGFGGFGQRLVREVGIPAVVAMADRISIKTAKVLAESFYIHMTQHGELDRALSEASVTLQDRPDITIPVLFSRLGGKPLFSDTLERTLTTLEINHGLDRLGEYLEIRAPVLLDEYQVAASNIKGLLDVELEALSPAAKHEREISLTKVNEICGEALDLSFKALSLGQKPLVYDNRCPFRGLYAFGPEDRQFFFGRQPLVGKLASRLQEYPFLSILGPSGSGKSSLVMAGLIPHLGMESVYLVPGSDPEAAMEAAMQSFQDPELVVVDQFEELFTLCPDETKRQAFIQQLLKLSETINVVLTMRADFLGQCVRYPLLREAIQTHQELVAPMQAPELRRAIEQQAQVVGLRFEAGLAQGILDDVEGEPGAMPLLQHALLLLWHRRHGRWLRWEEYEAFGGIKQAIAHTADQIYRNLDARNKEPMRDIFLRLTQIDDEAGDEPRLTRRRVAAEELVPASQSPNETIQLVHRLADARLVVTSLNPVTSREEVEVAHESLIRNWPRLRGWLDEDRANIRIQQQLTEATKEWLELDQDPGALYRGLRLLQAEAWAMDSGSRLSELETRFLAESRAALIAEEQAQLRARQRARRTPVYSFIGGALGFALSFVLVASPIVENQGLLLILTVLRLIAGGLAGFFLVFLVDLTTASGRRQSWTAWLLGGLSGSGVFALLLYFDNLLRVSAVNNTLPYAALAGGLWGFPAGLGRVWTLKDDRSPRRMVTLAAIFCGLILMLMNQIAPVFDSVSAITVFLSGAVVPCAILIAAHLADPGEERRSK